MTIKDKRYVALSLPVNVSWTLVGNIVYAATQWGILVILAKNGRAEYVGDFTLALAITAPVMEFSNLKLREVLTTDAQNIYQVSNYFLLRIISSAIGLIVIILIIWGLGYGYKTAMTILFIAVAKVFENISDILHGLMQKRERMDYITISKMQRGIISLLVVFVALYFTNSFIASMLCLTITWGCVLLLYDLRIAVRILQEFKVGNELFSLVDVSGLYKLTKLGFPLGVVAVLVSIRTSIPRFFLESYYGEAALGYHAAIAYIPVAGATIIGALGQSALPRLARDYTVNRSAYRRLMFNLVSTTVILCFCAIAIANIFGHDFLLLMYQPEYAERSLLFQELIIAGCLEYIILILGVGLTAARAFKIQAIILVALLPVNILTSWLLIPGYGEQGIVWVILINVVIWLVCILSATILVFKQNGEEHDKQI